MITFIIILFITAIVLSSISLVLWATAKKQKAIKPEKIIGKWVKYSEETAWENPDMIKREFDRIVSQTQLEIKNTKELTEYYGFKIFRSNSGNSISFINGGSKHPFHTITKKFMKKTKYFSDYHYDIDEPVIGDTLFIPKEDLLVSVEDVLAAFKRNEALHSQVKTLQCQLEEIEQEEEEFERKYGTF